MPIKKLPSRTHTYTHKVHIKEKTDFLKQMSDYPNLTEILRSSVKNTIMNVSVTRLSLLGSGCPHKQRRTYEGDHQDTSDHSEGV